MRRHGKTSEMCSSNLDPEADDRSQLGTPVTQQSNSSSAHSLDTAEVRLDIKKFAQLLHSQQPHAEKMVLSKCADVTFDDKIGFSSTYSSDRFLSQQHAAHLHCC